MHRLNLCSGYFGDKDLSRSRAFIAKVGEERLGLELMLPEGSPEADARLQAQVADFQDVYVSCHGPFRKVEASDEPNSPEGEAFRMAFAHALAWAEAYGAPTIIAHTRHRPYPDLDPARLRQNIISQLTQIAREFLGGTPIRLLVENVGFIGQESMLFGEEDFIALFDQLPPEVGCVLDLGHAAMNRWDIERLQVSLGSRIHAYHLHHNDGVEDLHQPLFAVKGFFSPQETRGILAVAERHSPRADWVMEYHSRDGAPSEALIESEMDEILACRQF